MQRRIQRAKRSVQPRIPTTIDEAEELIMEHPEYKDAFEGGVFYQGRVQTADGGDAFVFISPKLLPEIAQTIELQADGTFKSLPLFFKQLFTLHVSRFGQVYPFAFVLMNKKTRQLYDAVLDKILTVYDDLYPDVYLNVERLMSDFENAIQSSCEQAFVGCTCIGCWFHYGQAIWRRVQKYGLTGAYRSIPTVCRIVKEMIALALLPADAILAGFQDIKNTHREDLRRESVEIQAAIKRLMDYYYGYWIDTITPEGFSVFQMPNRTNNLVEAWHRWFNKRCGGSHLNFWDFIHALKESENAKMRDYQADEIKGADYIKPKTPFQRRRDSQIAENERLYLASDRKAEDIRNFLVRARYFTEPDLSAPVQDGVALHQEGHQDQPEGAVEPVVQPRRRYLAGTARPATSLDNGVADEPVNPADPVENADPNVSADVAVPATPTEQDGPLDVTGADVLEETANQPAPTGRGHRRRRPPASLSPGGDFILPPSRRPRLDPNTAAIRQAAPSGTVRGRRGRGRETRSQPNVRGRTAPVAALLCSVCKVNPKNTVFYPCGFFLCNNCSSNIRDGDGICPHCNEHAEESVTVIM
ncbi:Uncharacterized protein APZ42_011937 [Daphnia magna]|uniref:RING-type domain-containing protein n=1 Tax=Daphnia magna TaxID=35525 RepID=A0A162SCS2_9CRUS|nr:Uncharacterized protein APZ42_011937 [Daphnia magna]